jgi:hypothetical protein
MNFARRSLTSEPLGRSGADVPTHEDTSERHDYQRSISGVPFGADRLYSPFARFREVADS